MNNFFLGMLCHDAMCLALELETLAHDSFHLARNGNHKICLLSMLCEGIIGENSVEIVLVLMCISESSWAA